MNYPNIGDAVDVLELRELRKYGHINIYLYMDADVAKHESVEESISKYHLIDPDFRPVLEIEDWFKLMKKQMKQIAGASANIEEMLKAEPLITDVLEIGSIQTAAGVRPYMKCLLPYLDEMNEVQVKNASEIK